MTRTADLPIHFRTGLRALGIVNGRPVWPILGGEESEDAAEQAAARAAADAAGAGEDKGYPAHTPVEQMNDRQQASYWKHNSKNWESRAGGNWAMLQQLGIKKADDIPSIKEKIEKHDALEFELSTTAEKAAAKAADDAKAAVHGELRPALISARLDAAAARQGVSDEDLQKAIEFIDTNKFLTADGQVDADKVKTFVSTIAPAKGTTQQSKGPTIHGHGSGGGSASSSSGSAATGAELFAQRHAKKTA